VAWVKERVEAHYRVQEEEMGTVYTWCPQSTVVQCECGEKLVLIGQEDNYWRWGNTLLECGGCEEKFVLL
jgi:hypothetical protein